MVQALFSLLKDTSSVAPIWPHYGEMTARELIDFLRSISLHRRDAFWY